MRPSPTLAPILEPAEVRPTTRGDRSPTGAPISTRTAGSQPTPPRYHRRCRSLTTVSSSCTLDSATTPPLAARA